MRACPRCGAPNPDGSPTCGKCGMLLGPQQGAFKGTIAGLASGGIPAGPQPTPGALKGTMVGMAPAAMPVAPQQPAQDAFKGTIAGMAPGPSRAAPQQPAQTAFKGTMVGMAPAGIPADSAFQPGTQQPGRNPALGGTMIGMTGAPPAAPSPQVAPEGFAPKHQTLIGAVAANPAPTQPQPVAPPAGGSMKQTMLGVAGGPRVAEQSFAAAAPQASPHVNHVHSGPPSMQQTFAGGVGTGHPPSQPPAAARPGSAMKQTMIGGGMAPIPNMTSQPPAPAPSAMKQTMIGGGVAPMPNMASQPPASAPAGTMVYAPSPQASPVTQGHAAHSGGQTQAVPYQPAGVPNQTALYTPESAPQQQPKGAPGKQTVVGVAMPGIAPQHAGSAVRVAQSPALQPIPLPEPPAAPKIGGLPKGGLVLIAVAGLLAVAALVVALLWRSPHPVTAQVLLDDRGAEQVAVQCEDCADGATIAIGPDHATFASKKAIVPLTRPLGIGKNDLRVSLHRPGIGRDEEVTLAVSVDYRAHGDLGKLSSDPPIVSVVAEAVPGAAAIVDGAVVPLDASGRGERSFELRKELEGPSDTIVPFEKRVPYTITVAGTAHRGEVLLRFGIVPLRIDAPGESIIVDQETFVLSGRTVKDGRVSVAGRAITVDPDGRFAQTMNVSSIGETTIVVRADAKDQAPRFVRVRVKRVASLSEEADDYRRNATTDYAALESGGTGAGQRVVLDGEVAEARRDGEMTVLLLDTKTGCASAPCLAKVVYGGHFDTEKGATVGAFGTFGGLVEGARTGTKIPLVSAEFLLRTKKH